MQQSAGSFEARAAKTTEILAVAGIAGTAFFALTLVSLHFLQPNYNPAIQSMSEFAVGPYGPLMTVAFFVFGLTSIALAFGFHRAVAPSRSSKGGSILVGLFGVGILLDGIFPTDPTGGPATTAGAVHNTAAFVAFIGLIVAAFLLSKAFKGAPRWQPFQGRSRTLAFLVLGGFLASFFTFPIGIGIGQRIFASTVLVWLLVTGARLRLVATYPVPSREKAPSL